MATTYTLIKFDVFGSRRAHTFYVTDTSYPANGIVMTAAALGMAIVDVVLPVSASGAFWATYDPTYLTVRLWTATTVEYASTAGAFYALVLGS